MNEKDLIELYGKFQDKSVVPAEYTQLFNLLPSYFFIFEILRNTTAKNESLNTMIPKFELVVATSALFDSGLFALLDKYQIRKNSDQSNRAQLDKEISQETANLLSLFQQLHKFTYMDIPIFNRVVQKIARERTDIQSSHDLIYKFYGCVISNHSLYGMVYRLHHNPDAKINWKNAAIKFMGINNIDPTYEDEIVQKFERRFRTLLSETMVCSSTFSLIDNYNKHVFTSELNDRMLQLLSVQSRPLGL